MHGYPPCGVALFVVPGPPLAAQPVTMCGIAGFLSRTPPDLQRTHLQGMCDRLAHRGPDGFGYFSDGVAGLGHRRLSIIDLATGAQPLANEDGTIQIIFNGEIYNYRELRKSLEPRHDFKTTSDTEVLVHLYEDVGERLPEFLNGMFAFAIWNTRTRHLFLARDRFGEKPLYYTSAIPGFSFAFASELKALRALPGFAFDVDPASAADYLCLSYVPDPKSICRNIHKLPAAHSLLVTPEGVREPRRYWQPVFASATCPPPRRTLDEWVEEAGALASDAVARRMISDVPLGAFLSGGVDSSLAVGFMSRHQPGDVRTYSIGFTAREFDETHYANQVAQQFKTLHHEEVITPDVMEMLGTLLEHYDEPFADSSAIPMLYLARMTRRHVTVALSGDGADEVFAGYRRYAFGHLESNIRRVLPAWFRRPVLGFAGRVYPKFDYLPRPFRAKMLLTALSQEVGDSYFTTMTGFRDRSLEAILSSDFRAALGGYCPRADYRARFEKFAHLNALEQLQAVDLETYLPGDILVKADRATMAYSLEGRAPWLDHRLAELAFQLPTEYKLRGTTGKFMFKKLAERQVPAEVIWRPKMGFQVPLAHWLRTSLREVFESTVLGSGASEFIERKEARRLWTEHQSGLSNHDRKLWTLFVLCNWKGKN